jgi:DNA-binding response OmpR family regulator
VNLPDQNGLALCQSLKREGGLRSPVLFLTARDALDDKLAAFEAGAVDYMVKPFAPAELLARARAITAHVAQAGGLQLRVGAYVLDLQRHLLQRKDDALPLHASGFVLMRALMEASPGVVSRQALCDRLWQGDPPDSDPLRMHVYQLRQHCQRAFGAPWIASVRGVGYRFSEETVDA